MRKTSWQVGLLKEAHITPTRSLTLARTTESVVGDHKDEIDMRFLIVLLLIVVAKQCLSLYQGEESFASFTRERRTIEPFLKRLQALNGRLFGFLGLGHEEEETKEVVKAKPQDVQNKLQDARNRPQHVQYWPQDVHQLQAKPSPHLVSTPYRQHHQQKTKQQSNEIKQEQNKQQQPNQNYENPKHFLKSNKGEKMNNGNIQKPNPSTSPKDSAKSPEMSHSLVPVYTPPSQVYATSSTTTTSTPPPTTTTTTTTTTRTPATTVPPLRYHYSRLTPAMPTTTPPPLYRSQIHYLPHPIPIQNDYLLVQQGSSDNHPAFVEDDNYLSEKRDPLDDHHVENGDPLDDHHHHVENGDPLVTWLQAPAPSTYPHFESFPFSDDLNEFTFQQDMNKTDSRKPKRARSHDNPGDIVNIDVIRPLKSNQINTQVEFPMKAAKSSDLDGLDQSIMEAVFADFSTQRDTEVGFQFFHPLVGSLDTLFADEIPLSDEEEDVARAPFQLFHPVARELVKTKMVTKTNTKW